MKNIVKCFTLTIVLLVAMSTFIACDSNNDETMIMGEGGIIYSLQEDGTYGVSYLGDEKEVIIPNTHNGKAVTSIRNFGFNGGDSLTCITIPDSVTSIGESAFSGCSSLKSVYYTGNIASWCGISFYNLGSNPLHNAHNLYFNNELAMDIVIPDTVTEIKKYAFTGWDGASVVIADSVTSIGEYAFFECSRLTSITIPNNVTSIGDGAFWCPSLTSISISDSVTSIGDGAFSYCPIKTATIPAMAIPYIKNDALQSVTITSGTIENEAFYNYNSLTSITILDSVTSIGKYAFGYCTGLTSITIPDSVTSIGEYAFCDCSSLTSITIPDSVTSIGHEAFWACSSLTSITFTGTKAQWNAITKDSFWNYDTGSYTIHCADGDIVK